MNLATIIESALTDRVMHHPSNNRLLTIKKVDVRESLDDPRDLTVEVTEADYAGGGRIHKSFRINSDTDLS